MRVSRTQVILALGALCVFVVVGLLVLRDDGPDPDRVHGRPAQSEQRNSSEDDSGGPTRLERDRAANDEPQTDVESSTPSAARDSQEVSTLELLEAMKSAYLEGDNSRLNELRDMGVARNDLEREVAVSYYLRLIVGTHERHDDEPTLENAVADVLLAAWVVPEGGEAEWQSEVFRFATSIANSPSFGEIDGHWREGTEDSRHVDKPHFQREAYIRPDSDVDTLALGYLIDQSLAMSGLGSFSRDVSLVSLFDETEDYVSDRLSYFQIFTCELLVRLDATQHADDLWRLAQNAVIQDVQAAALDAFIQLGGAASVIDVGERWATLAADPENFDTVKSQIESLAQSEIGASRLVEVARAFFESLRARGVDWTQYSSALAWHASRSGRHFGTEDPELLDAIRKEDNPAMLAAWGNLAGLTYGGTNDNIVLAILEERLHAVLRGQVECDSTHGLHYVISSLLLGYSNVLSKDRKGEWFVPLLKEAYSIAEQDALEPLDELLVFKMNDRYTNPTNDIVRMYEAAMPRLLPMTREDEHLRKQCVQAWGKLQVGLAHERLSDLAVASELDYEKDFYRDALAEWEKESGRANSGE